MAQAATANGHTHGGPDHKHTSKCNHPAPVYAKGFNENALTIQKIIGVINAVLGVTILLNPEYVTAYMLKGAPMEVQMFALISMLGATQLFAGVLIMSGYMSFTAFWVYGLSELVVTLYYFHYWQNPDPAEVLFTDVVLLHLGATALVCLISAVGAAAMFEEPLLAPPALRNDVLRVLACYAFWFKGIMCAYYPDEVQQFYLTAPITTPVGVLVVKLIGIHSMHAGVLILLGVLKDKAMHWAAGSMIFYATVVYLYYEQGALKTEALLDAAFNVAVAATCFIAYEPLFPSAANSPAQAVKKNQ